MKSVYMWQNNFCITYTIIFKKYEDYFYANGFRMCDNPEDADLLFMELVPVSCLRLMSILIR